VRLNLVPGKEERLIISEGDPKVTGEKDHAAMWRLGRNVSQNSRKNRH